MDQPGRPIENTEVLLVLSKFQGTTQPDIFMATRQCTRFNNDPKLSHELVVKRIVRYLLGIQDKAIIFKPDLSRGLECYVDVDFNGGWNNGDHKLPYSVLSRTTDDVIMYASCPLYWGCKLPTKIALGTSETKYIALDFSSQSQIPRESNNY